MRNRSVRSSSSAEFAAWRSRPSPAVDQDPLRSAFAEASGPGLPRWLRVRRSGIPSRSTRSNPMRRWSRTRGRLSRHAGRPPHPRRDLVLVGGDAWPRHPKIVDAIQAKAKPRPDTSAGFTHEPAERLGREACADRLRPRTSSIPIAARPRRSRAEDGARLFPQPRRPALAHRRHGARLSRRHDGRDVGRGESSTRPTSRLLFEVARIPFPAAGREQETLDALDAAAATGRRAPSSSRWCWAPAGCSMYRPRTAGDAAHPAHTAVHCRRGHDRLGPHGHDVRLRAGGIQPRHPLHVQGLDRRLAAVAP